VQDDIIKDTTEEGTAHQHTAHLNMAPELQRTVRLLVLPEGTVHRRMAHLRDLLVDTGFRLFKRDTGRSEFNSEENC
jgi:hypothetical protein